MKSLTEIIHLLNYNTGILRGTHEEQKSSVEQKNKSFFDFNFQYKYKSWKYDLLIL